MTHSPIAETVIAPQKKQKENKRYLCLYHAFPNKCMQTPYTQNHAKEPVRFQKFLDADCGPVVSYG